MTLRGIPVDTDAARDDIHNIQRIVPNFELDQFNQDQDVYGDSDDSASETSSEGDWASGDDEVAAAIKYYVPSNISDEDLDSEDDE
ncbi:hypothetical protein FRC01_014554 [Tulasnella sp. 417]|nr:hypothetical protein FRC01_014554 [Tulasnella sp. 417]